ncbi:MAG: SDR family oxidoreductase [Candidatus Methylacidiphilales bacterium]|nr:SDR family oxidoreductase [Candidatus Methylacidiphilales bacterium]
MPVVVITGASRGIGKAIAEVFARESWSVIAPARAELDLSDPASIRAWCAGPGSGQGPIDALVHSAGINRPLPVRDIPDEVWAETFQINLNALRLLLQGLGTRLDGGRILALGSIFGLVSRPGRGAYAASKAALSGFIRTLAVEEGPKGTLANVLCPGYVDTDLTRSNNTPEQIASLCQTIPLRRLAKPEEIAHLAHWLCSEQNSYITGQSIVCDGGFTSL